MRMVMRSLLGLLMVLALALPASAGGLVALHGGGWVGFFVTDGELAKRLTKQDLFFLGLELRHRVFQQYGPLSQTEPQMPVVVLPDPSPVHAVELDQAIERLARLIRDAEREGSGRPAQ
jgi:hypothetical protein